MRIQSGKALCAGILLVLSAPLVRTEQNSLSDLPQQAIERSQITLPGSQPFHLKARVVEATNLQNDSYRAEIEEYWAAPDQWRRTVKTEEFSQTLVLNGEKTYQELTGDYYPNWLRTMVQAIFEPGKHLQGVDISKSSDNPRPDYRVATPDGRMSVVRSPQLCRRFGQVVGIPPATNTVFFSYCFQEGRLESISVPGYDASYSEYKRFGEKDVARKIREWIESGTELEARIELLEKLPDSSEALFSIRESTPPLETVVVTEQTLLQLAQSPPAIVWPPIHGGKSVGRTSIYVCIDRGGKLRETYGLNSDHPEMTDAAREQVSHWTFKKANSHGIPVQVEGILTFAYETRLEPK